MATRAGCRGWCALENEIPGCLPRDHTTTPKQFKSAALEIRAVMEDGGPFSIAEWAAQATPAPKVEPKDDAPASKVELIDLTDDVDSPRRDGSNATTEGGRVDDGATTDGLRRAPPPPRRPRERPPRRRPRRSRRPPPSWTPPSPTSSSSPSCTPGARAGARPKLRALRVARAAPRRARTRSATRRPCPATRGARSSR